MTDLLEALQGVSVPDRDSFRPVFFRLDQGVDQVRLKELLKPGHRVRIHDALNGQLAELVRVLNPSIQFTNQELEESIRTHLNGTEALHYGVWVYFPWSSRLVHMLDEKEFVQVRTDRNRNKITREEQALLATKRVGVIGLSVGQSVALTMAQERCFGEIRLADFDTLDLSNLNRIRSGVHQLGLNKAILAAREIMEIDPYLQVTCFTEGITCGNLDRFLTEGGKLDLLVEECDSVDVKILARQRAKHHRIAVVMDTNDRGMIDVERFDLEPDRPLMHGLIDHLDPDDAAKARTIEEKLPFLAPMAGLDNLSPRMKASMIEVGHSIRTWPQLATSTVLGGALTGDVCRRIALDQFRGSGRWYVDMEALIGGTNTHGAPSAPVYDPAPPPPSSHVELSQHIKELRPNGQVGLTDEEARALAMAGALAPSADNMQPWKFLFQGGRLFLYHDRSRSASVLDPGSLIPHLGLGMCVENILLRAKELGIALTHSVAPLPDEPLLIAVFDRGRTEPSPNSEVDRVLAGQLAMRHTNRMKGDELPIPEHALDPLSAAALAIDGCRVHILRDRAALDALADICGAADRLRLMNEHGHREFFQHQLRWTPEEVARTRDGLDVDTLELGAAGRIGLRMASAPLAMRTLAAMGGGRSLEKLASDTVRSAGAVALLTMPGLSLPERIKAGRAAERMWLQASAMNIALHPLSAPIFLSYHARLGGAQGFSASEKQEALQFHERLRSIFGSGAEEPFFMVRISKAGPATARALRRPFEELYQQA